MDSEASLSQLAPPVFDGENHQHWTIRMETYLQALDLWEAVEEDYEVPPLPNNPTMAQVKTHKERKTRKSKAKACLFAAVSATIFTSVTSLKNAKVVWDYTKEEYVGDERIRGMQVLNLIREFELHRMKESKTIKEYSDRLFCIINKGQEQRRLMRQEGTSEGALPAKYQDDKRQKKKKKKKHYKKHQDLGNDNAMNI